MKVFLERLTKLFSEWKIYGFVFLLVVIFAFFIRLINLNIIPVFADEAIYVRWSQIMNTEPTLRFLPLSDGKQPLYMWILMFVVNKFSDPLLVGRFLSICSGVFAAIGVFGVTQLLFSNKKVSLLAAFLWLITPFSFFFDRMALVDSLLNAFFVWTIFFVLLTVKKLRLDAAMIAGFFLGFALLTKSPAIFAILLFPVAVIFLDYKAKKDKIIGDIIKYLSLLFVTVVIGYGLYNILRLGPNFHLIGSRNQDYVFSINHLWLDPSDPFIFHVKQVFGDWIVKMGPWPILLLGVVGFVAGYKKYSKEVVFLSAWFLVPVLIQAMFAKVFTVRYILFALPPLFILSSLLLFSKNRWVTYFGYIMYFLFTILAFRFNYLLMVSPGLANLPSSERSGYLEEWTSGVGIRQAADYIKNIAKEEGIRVVVGTEGYFGTLPDGFSMYLQGIKNVTVIGVGLEIKETPQSLLDSVNSGNKTYFLINSSRLRMKESDYSQNKLVLLNSWDKTPRREKLSREYILYGEKDTLYLFEVVK